MSGFSKKTRDVVYERATGCHGDVERFRLTSLADGLLLGQRQDPATTPVQLRHGLVLLHDDGTYTHTERNPS